jgi:hypothetical protein
VASPGKWKLATRKPEKMKPETGQLKKMRQRWLKRRLLRKHMNQVLKRCQPMLVSREAPGKRDLRMMLDVSEKQGTQRKILLEEEKETKKGLEEKERMKTRQRKSQQSESTNQKLMKREKRGPLKEEPARPWAIRAVHELKEEERGDFEGRSATSRDSWTGWLGVPMSEF